MFDLLKGFVGNITFGGYFNIFLIISGIIFLSFVVYKIHDAGEKSCMSGVRAEKISALEKELFETQQYQKFLLENQKKNIDFINRQRKALKDAKEQDGDVAPVLRGTIDRLCRESGQKSCDK